MRIHKTTIWWTSPVFLCLVLIMFITCPVLTPGTYADATKTSTTGSHVSIALTGSTVLDLQPDVSDGFSYSTSDLVISTSSTAGFKVMLSSTDQGNLISPDTTDSSIIQSLSEASTPTDFTTNSWGYYLGTADPDSTSTYEPIPSEAAVILDTDIATDASYKLAFGAKVDYDLPAGVYHTTLLVSAVANPTTLGALDQITYMQEMTPEICANTTNYVDKDHYATKQLIDSRDNKSYWVAKLADGNCWMVQDLALTYPRNLAPANSDVTVTYRLESGAMLIEGQYYYTYNSATAGTATSGASLVPSSICSRGWKLPTTAEWRTVINAYDMLQANSGYTPTEAPFYVPLSGYYYPHTGNINNKKGGSYYYTSTPSSVSSSDLAVFSSTVGNFETVLLSLGYVYSVRCVAR